MSPPTGKGLERALSLGRGWGREIKSVMSCLPTGHPSLWPEEEPFTHLVPLSAPLPLLVAHVALREPETALNMVVLKVWSPGKV